MLSTTQERVSYLTRRGKGMGTLKDVSMKSLKSKVSTDERLLERVLLTWGVDTEVNARSLRLDTALARMQQRFFARKVFVETEANSDSQRTDTRRESNGRILVCEWIRGS